LEQLIAVAFTIDQEVDCRHQASRRCLQGLPGGLGDEPEHVECVLEGRIGPEEFRLGAFRQVEDHIHDESIKCMTRGFAEPCFPVLWAGDPAYRAVEPWVCGDGVGPRGLEPRTSALSGQRSNRAELWAHVAVT